MKQLTIDFETYENEIKEAKKEGYSSAMFECRCAIKKINTNEEVYSSFLHNTYWTNEFKNAMAELKAKHFTKKVGSLSENVLIVENSELEAA